MRFDIITIFPEFFTGPLDYGIVRRAREAGLIQVAAHDLRDFTHDRHRTVDDRPFGGGEGMVLKPEPLFEAVESLTGNSGTLTEASVILLSASGKVFRQDLARKLSRRERIVLLCGRYEGVDERVAQHLATEEISIGDFVLSGGELPAAIVLDAVTRLLPGALGNEASAVQESFSSPDIAGTAYRAPTSASIASLGLLDCPHYTRPQSFRGWEVPEVLISGNHEQIRRWRRQQALAKTLRNRPELLDAATLADEDRRLLAEIG
ncbi:MAG: tRNA (guanosine(37)-N1)-methyltransferase TrmD [Candidatus Acidiferrales bacterium]